MKKYLLIAWLVLISPTIAFPATEQFYLAPKHMNKLASPVTITVSSVEQAPVLKRGAAGSWDGIDVLNPSVIKFKGKFFNYYSGFDGTVWKTGVATSTDGINWEKYSNNPVLEPSPKSWERQYIAANGGAVVFDGKILYAYQGIDEKGTTHIGLAESKNGYTFTKRSLPILSPTRDGGWESLAVADPYLFTHEGILYLFYLGQNDALIQRLGVAKSSDGVSWVRSAANPLLDIGARGTFDENGLGEPSVAYQHPYFYMLYTGRAANEYRNIGYALSLDGIQWRKMSTEGLVNHGLFGEWASKVICDTTFYYIDNGRWLVWFGGGNVAHPAENINGNIGLFTVDLTRGVDTHRFEAVSSIWDSIYVGDIVKGAYGIEGHGTERFVWCAPKTEILLNRLKDAPQSEIIVKGFSRAKLFAETTGDLEPQRIAIYIDNKLAASKSFTTNSPFEFRIPTQSIPATETFALRIESSKYLVPAAHKLNTDSRTLAFMLTYAGFEHQRFDPYRFEAASNVWDSISPDARIKGAYSIEDHGSGRYVWCAPRAELVLRRLPVPPESGLIIRGASMAGLFAETTGEMQPQRITFYIDNTQVSSESLSVNGPFEFRIPAKFIPATEKFTLRIESSKYLVPAAHKLNTDDRKLAFMLTFVGYE